MINQRITRNRQNKLTFILAVVIFVAVALIYVFIHSKSLSHRPNVILITIDALRADHLGCYGYERNTSPNIDKLANEGGVFLNCFTTSSSTADSSVGFLTGKYLMIFGSDEVAGVLDKKFLTLAERLHKRGYYNAAFLNNGHYDYTTGLERGFDEYQNYIGVAEDTSDRAIKFLQNYSRKKPFFLWVHYIDPHAPYFAHEEFLKIFEEDNLWRENNTKLDANPEADADSYESRGFIPKIVFTQGKYLASYYIASYDAEVCYTDSQIGRLLGILPENTLVILTADHGESMGEHNIYFSHGENIYDELLHVPLIIRDSTYFRGGKRIAETVSSLDIVPTVLSRVNPFWFIFNRGTFNGRDLNRILENKHPKPKYIFAYKPDVYSIRDIDRNIKYILEDAVKEELYFLPDENNNFIGEDSSDVNSIKNELRTNLLTWLEEHPLRSDIHPGNTLPDKEAQENLKSLGYIQ